MPSKSLLAACVASLFLGACQAGPPQRPEDVPHTSGMLSGVASGLAWLDGDTLWVGMDDDPRAERPESVPWLVEVEDYAVTRLELASDECFLADYLSAAHADARSAAFLRSCLPTDRAQAGDFSRVDKDLVIVDIAGRVTEVARLPDRATAITWNQPAAQGVVSVGSRVCQGLGWVMNGSVEPVRIPVPGTGLMLGEELERDSSDCSGSLRADAPSWSLNGELIALAASPDSVGVADRLGAPWNIYGLDLASGELTNLVQGVLHAGAVAAAPDGSVVALTGVRDGSAATYVVSVVTGDVRLVSRVSPYALAFSPDGASLAGAISPPAPSARSTEVRVWNLGDR